MHDLLLPIRCHLKSAVPAGSRTYWMVDFQFVHICKIVSLDIQLEGKHLLILFSTLLNDLQCDKYVSKFLDYNQLMDRKHPCSSCTLRGASHDALTI